MKPGARKQSLFTNSHREANKWKNEAHRQKQGSCRLVTQRIVSGADSSGVFLKSMQTKPFSWRISSNLWPCHWVHNWNWTSFCPLVALSFRFSGKHASWASGCGLAQALGTTGCATAAGLYTYDRYIRCWSMLVPCIQLKQFAVMQCDSHTLCVFSLVMEWSNMWLMWQLAYQFCDTWSPRWFFLRLSRDIPWKPFPDFVKIWYQVGPHTSPHLTILAGRCAARIAEPCVLLHLCVVAVLWNQPGAQWWKLHRSWTPAVKYIDTIRHQVILDFLLRFKKQFCLFKELNSLCFSNFQKFQLPLSSRISKIWRLRCGCWVCCLFMRPAPSWSHWPTNV